MDFTTPVPIGTASTLLYQVTVNDGGDDGGSTSRILISGFPASADLAPADAAAQALADRFAEAAGYRVIGISRITATETPL